MNIVEESSFLKDPKGYIVQNGPAKVLGFVGTVISFYAALMLQNCQAEQGFKGEYLEQLDTFKEELQFNASRKDAYTEVFGGAEQPGVGGALESYAKEMVESIAEADMLNECAVVYVNVMSELPDAAQNQAVLAQLSDADREWMVKSLKFLEECKKTCEKLKEDDSRFRSLNIDLGLSQDAWMALQRSPGRSFPNRELALELSRIYHRLGLIGKETEEIERELNNPFAKSMNNLQQAKISLSFILEEHLEEVDTSKEHQAAHRGQKPSPPPTPEQLDERFEHYTTLRANMNVHADDAYNAWTNTALKVARIKAIAQELGGLYPATQAFLAQESTATARGYFPSLSAVSRPPRGKKPEGAGAAKSAVSKAPVAQKKKLHDAGSK